MFKWPFGYAVFYIWLPGLDFIKSHITYYKIGKKYHFCSMLKTNQFSFIGKYKVWAHLELIKLTESGGIILDLNVHFAGLNVNM